MKEKRVIWTRSGFEIPGVGVTKEDAKSRLLPIAQANEFITRGLAKDVKTKAAAQEPSSSEKGDKS